MSAANFVASTMSLRRAPSVSPMTRSELPRSAYMSAVSNRVMPRSIALWITFFDISASARPPKLLQPMPTADTISPDRPRLRYSIVPRSPRASVGQTNYRLGGLAATA
jgi:hypothetical protein